MKVSAFTGTSDGSDESLLMLSYSTDGGVTYQTRKIRLDDFIDDFEVEDLANVTGTPEDGQILKWTGTTWEPSDPQTIILAPGLSNLQWKYQTDRSPATGNGFFSINNFTPQTTNLLYVDHETEDGRDVQNFVNSFVETGQRLYIQQIDDDAKYFIFDVTAAPIPNATSISIPVVDVASSSIAIDAGAECLFQFIPRQATGELELPDDIMREGEDVSLLTNDADYIAVGDPAASGYTLLALQNLQVEEGNLGRTILAVGYVASDFQQSDPTTPKPFEERGAVQVVSAGDGNAVTVYANGADYLMGITSQGPFFLDDGESFVIEVTEPGNIITMSEGGYGYSEQRRGADVSPMPLLSLGLAFRDSFLFAFRNSEDVGTGTNRGLIHVVAGPVPSKVSLLNGITGQPVLGQQDIEIGPFERATLRTDGNNEFRIKASEPIMACMHAHMGPGSERFYDSRLVMPLTNDGITWSRSGNLSSLYQNTEVTYYLNDESVPGTFTGNPGSPVDLDQATGDNTNGYQPKGAARFRAKGLVSAYSGADGAGLEATPMCPISVMSQKVPLVGLVEDSGNSQNNSIAVASPYEGTFQVWAPAGPGLPVQLVSFLTPDGLSTVTEIPLVRRGVTSPSSYVQQFHPASALIEATPNFVEDTHGFLSNFEGGYVLSNVPCMVIMNNTQGNDVDDTVLYRGSEGGLVQGVRANGDETLMLGISPELFKLNIRLAQDRLFYRQELTAGGVESWTRC